MKLSILLLVLLNALFVFCQVDDEDVERSHQRMAEMMKHDGIKRVIVIDQNNINKLLKKNRLLLIFFWIDNNKEAEKLNERDTQTLEILAQLFQERSVAVATCEMMANQQFVKASGVKYTGMIKIFNQMKVTTYSGQRSPDVMVPYLSKMLENSITIIQTKTEKKQLDANDLPKVVAYVEKNSKELKALTEAALSFQPMIPFFVIHDAKLAKVFRLKKLNLIQLIKPYEKAVTFPTKKEINKKSIIQFINDNKRQRLTKMRLENLHDIWAIDMVGYVVPIFAVLKHEDAIRFFSTAKLLAKHYEKNTNLSFVLIDPEPFPAMLEYWRQTFEINPLEPTIGVVDVHTQSSTWYKKSSENEDFKLRELKEWIALVLKGEVKLEPMKQVKRSPPPVQETENEEETGNEEEKEEL